MNPRKPDKFGGTMGPSDDSGDMGKEDRKRVVLKLLAESEFALPPAAIFRNAKLQGATFERRSVNTYLDELHEDGLVIKVDSSALDNGELKEVPLSDSGYFLATTKGREMFE